MAKVFEELFEEGNNVVTKGFPNAGLVKTKASTKTPEGISLAVTTKRTPKTMELILEPKLEISNRNLELAAILGTNNVYSGSVTLKDLVRVGSKVTATADLTDNFPSYKIAASFKSDVVAVKTTATIPGDGGKKPQVEASVAGTYERKYLVGASVKCVPPSDGKAIAIDWASAAGVKYKENILHTFVTSASMLLGLGFFHQATSYRMSANLSMDVKNVAGYSVVIGDEFELDNITSVKSRFSIVATPKAAPYDVRFAVSVKHALQSRFNVTVGADLNPRYLIGQNVGSDHSFGIEMELM